jgi:hypothetical protein
MDNVSSKGEGGGVIESEKWAYVVYGWPLGENKLFSFLSLQL